MIIFYEMGDPKEFPTRLVRIIRAGKVYNHKLGIGWHEKFWPKFTMSPTEVGVPLASFRLHLMRPETLLSVSSHGYYNEADPAYYYTP